MRPHPHRGENNKKRDHKKCILWCLVHDPKAFGHNLHIFTNMLFYDKHMNKKKDP